LANGSPSVVNHGYFAHASFSLPCNKSGLANATHSSNRSCQPATLASSVMCLSLVQLRVHLLRTFGERLAHASVGAFPRAGARGCGATRVPPRGVAANLERCIMFAVGSRIMIDEPPGER
jgi:hypothetical protein